MKKRAEGALIFLFHEKMHCPAMEPSPLIQSEMKPKKKEEKKRKEKGKKRGLEGYLQ